MRWEIFEVQVKKLKEMWPQSYPNARVKVLWQEVKFLPDNVFEGMVDTFIGNERYAPLIDQFREMCSKYREKQRAIERAKYTQEAQEFYDGERLPDEDISLLMGTIIGRLQGKVSDKEWDDFQQTLSKLPQEGTLSSASTQVSKVEPSHSHTTASSGPMKSSNKLMASLNWED